MPTAKALLAGWMKRVRNFALRGPISDIRNTRSDNERLRYALEHLNCELAQLRVETGRQLDELRRTSESFQSLRNAVAEAGHFVDVTAEERSQDVTRRQAIGYLSWDNSVVAYRPAFQQAIDYLRSVQCTGPFLEFGTYSGFTARQMCELMNTRSFPQHLYLFDSFEGLPETTGTPDELSYEVSVNRVWGLGKMAVTTQHVEAIHRSLLQVRPAETIHIVKGFYENSLDAGLPREKCSLIHLDCDLYTSTQCVLEKLAEKDLFQDGCVLMFDDWNCNRANPEMGQRRALREFLERHPRWTCSQWFAYGWHAAAFLLHDREARIQGNR